MVSLKSFLHYFSPARPAQPLSEAEKQQIEALIQAFGGEANITQVDACSYSSAGDGSSSCCRGYLTHYSSRARWASLFSVSRCMLFSVSSPMRCVNCWMSILATRK